MDPLIGGALIGGAASLIGGAFSNSANASAQERAAAFNAKEAHEQRMWAQNQANTAWRRGVIDMKAAGINPMLAFSKGPAPMPTGSTASTQAAQYRDPITPAVQTMMSGLQTASQVAMNTANAQKALAEAKNTDADTKLKPAYFGLSDDANRRARELHPTAKALGEFDLYMKKQYGEIDKVLDMVSKGAGSLGDIMSLIPQKKGKDALFDMWKKYQTSGKTFMP